jgi:predicted GTPase
MRRTRVIIMGAGGRDFHNFNVRFRENEDHEVVAFTATQIPDIDDRIYPPILAGRLYPKGIPIFPEGDLPRLIQDHAVDEVIFAYSDVSHERVMHNASLVTALGADFRLMGTRDTMLRSRLPVVAVCAGRTGSGKSQTTRRVSELLKARGLQIAVVRHPMPYGDLSQQVVQRFGSYADLNKHKCTIEEREEYEPHLDRGTVVFAGVDYEKILRVAEEEADVVLWDGGNNDTPFFRPDLHITVVDPHRPGHEVQYHPGETNLRMADVVVINKETTTSYENTEVVRQNVMRMNPGARIVDAASPLFLENGESLRGRRVLVIEDGPTVTHGDMSYGAGVIAARRYGASELVDPRPYAIGSIKRAYEMYPHMGPVLPALGYGAKQIRELERTISATPVDIVVIATPIDLRRIARFSKPTLRVRYELAEIGTPTLDELLSEYLRLNGRSAHATTVRSQGNRSKRKLAAKRATPTRSREAIARGRRAAAGRRA